MLFIKGVSKELPKEKLPYGRLSRVKSYLKNISLSDIDNTPTAKGVVLKWPTLPCALSKISLDDEAQLNELYDLLKDDL